MRNKRSMNVCCACVALLLFQKCEQWGAGGFTVEGECGRAVEILCCESYVQVGKVDVAVSGGSA